MDRGETTVILLGSFHYGAPRGRVPLGMLTIEGIVRRVIRRERISGASRSRRSNVLTECRAASTVSLLKPHNYTLLYAYEPLESLLLYQAIPGGLIDLSPALPTPSVVVAPPPPPARPRADTDSQT